MALTRRQKQVFDFVKSFIEQRGYAPSLEEIGHHFGLSSVATVHKHVTNLVRKGLLRRGWNQNRSLEIVGEREAPRAVEVPILGRVVRRRPLQGGEVERTLTLPPWLVSGGRTYLLEVADDSLRDEMIARGDWLVVEERRIARDGDLVLAFVQGEEVALWRYGRDGESVLLLEGGGPERRERWPADQVEIRGVIRGLLRRC